MRNSSTPIVRMISGGLAIAKQWHCLELGWCFGKFLAYSEAAECVQIHRVDSSRECARLAKAEYWTNPMVCEDIFDFPAKADRSFDLISAVDLIEHLKNMRCPNSLPWSRGFRSRGAVARDPERKWLVRDGHKIQ